MMSWSSIHAMTLTDPPQRLLTAIGPRSDLFSNSPPTGYVQGAVESREPAYTGTGRAGGC